MPGAELHFTLKDLEEWAKQGLITPEQLTRIRQRLETAESLHEQTQAAPEPRKRLNLISIAYYFGGFMILLAYTIFMGLEWESLGLTGQLAVSFFTIVALWAIGYFLQRKDFRVAGGLLIFVGTGIVPLFVYTVQRALGIWPDASHYAYRDFYQIIAQTWIPLEIVSITVAAIVIWRVRFPLISLLISFWTWFLSMDLVHWITRSDYWTWSETEQIVGILIGAGMLILGIFLQRKTNQDYSLWLYLFGHLIVFVHFSALALEKEGLLGIVYFVVYLSFVAASVWLQRRVFLVFGALGCYAYVSYLAFRVFEGALGFAFALAGVGLIIVLSAVGYQKYMRPRLERYFGRYRIS